MTSRTYDFNHNFHKRNFSTNNPSNLKSWRESYSDAFQGQKSKLDNITEENVNYQDMLEKMMSLTATREEIGNSFRELNEEIREMQDISFRGPHAAYILENMPVESIMILAIESFIGKVSSPRNEALSNFLMKFAENRKN